MEADLRKRVREYVDSADERLLNVLKAVAESYNDNDVVGHTVEGKPLTRKEYYQELINAEEEIEQGKIISQEDFERKSENW